MTVSDHPGAKTEPVVRLAKTRVGGPAQELVDRGAVAVGAVEVSAAVEGQSKRIHLPPRPGFDPRAVGQKAEDVARMQFQLPTPFGPQDAGIAESMGGVDPAIPTQAQARNHSVGVLFITKRTKDHLAQVGATVPVGVREIPQVGNAPGETAIGVPGPVPGQDTRRDVRQSP